LYLNNVYMQPELQDQLKQAFTDAGVKFDMGKSCLRLRDLETAPLDAIGEVIAGTPPDALIEIFERTQQAYREKKAAGKGYKQR
ncbi:MAG: DUF1801 domain-containing protein, partial [Anaerolineae bacterium]|nr:DUF1801 domain-containing protein [Anaerolineae bacterium]